MGKKFVFNPETLSFEISKFSLKETIKNILPQLLISLVLGSLFGYVLIDYTKTPELKKLETVNENILSKYQNIEQKINNQEIRLAIIENNDDYSYRTVLGLNPIPYTTRMLGYGGNAYFDVLQDPELLKAKELTDECINISNRIKLEAESFALILTMVKDRDRMVNSIPSVYPLDKKQLLRIGSGFGYRMHPILHVWKMHTGIDLSAHTGTPIYATGDGIVVQAEYTTGGYGKCIRIDHGYSYQTLYGHLSKILVSPGQVVKRGQLIGLVGSTGRSTAPHLHYEVRINNKPVNPINFMFDDMTEQEYQEMLQNAANGTSNDAR